MIEDKYLDSVCAGCAGPIYEGYMRGVSGDQVYCLACYARLAVGSPRWGARVHFRREWDSSDRRAYRL